MGKRWMVLLAVFELLSGVGSVVAAGEKPPISVRLEVVSDKEGNKYDDRIMIIKNRSETETLILNVTVKDRITREPVSTTFRLRPKRTWESFQNWSLRVLLYKGDTYIIKAHGYPVPVTGTVRY